MKAILIGGAAVLAAGAVALAFTQDRRETPPQAPEVAHHEATPPPTAELADPGTIPVEEPKAEVVVDTGYEVDPDGFVWEPLSFDHPQIKNNGDGTVTMKKLARIVEAGGKVREVPITVNAAPQQRRLPVRSRATPASKQEPAAEETATTTDQDGG
jgi:hypothetical protein